MQADASARLRGRGRSSGDRHLEPGTGDRGAEVASSASSSTTSSSRRDPARPLRTPKKREALPDVLTMAELERLLAATGRANLWSGTSAGKPERDLLLLALMAYAGLRRRLLGLAWDDVDLWRRLLSCGRPRAGASGSIPIHPALAPLFAGYYATRQSRSSSSRSSSASRASRLNYTQLGQVFRHYVASSGVGERKRVTPHTLRHVFASELLRAGANLRQVQELLGHKHLDSTQRYTRVTAHELRGAVKRLRWVGHELEEVGIDSR